MSPLSEASIRAAIEAHLRRWPGAADTARGIARWWLGECAPEPTDRVERVLEQMVSDGEMRVSVLPDGTRLWGATRGGA